MSSFVGGFTWDLFISYAHVDNRATAGGRRWVEDFSKALCRDLDILLGRSYRAQVFRDPNLRTSERFSEALDRHVQDSAVFLALLSSGYQDSVFCHRELGLFVSAATRSASGLVTPSGYQRIVPVFLADRSKLVLGAPVNEVLGHDFSDPRHKGFPILPSDPRFTGRMRELAQMVADLLLDLRGRPAESRVGEANHAHSTGNYGQLFGLLRDPVLGMLDEERRSALIAEAFAVRAPALHRKLKGRMGTADEFIHTLIHEAAAYGPVDTRGALTTFCDTLLGHMGHSLPGLGEARDRAISIDSANGRFYLEVRERESRCMRRMFDQVELDIVIEDPSADRSPAWELREGQAPRWLIVERGRKTRTRTTSGDPSWPILQLQHPHVLPVIDFLESEGETWAECEWRPGRSLHELALGPMSLGEIRDYAAQIADALDHVHCRGVVHGRLGPKSVLLDESRSFVAITGLGYVTLEGAPGACEVWRGTGRNDYFAAPEAMLGHPTPESDQYSLAMLVCAMFLGHDDQGRDAAELREAVSHIAPDPVLWVLEKALSNDPLSRFSSTIEFADALWWALDTGSQLSEWRLDEHRYLNVLRQECIDPSRGYVPLRGRSDQSITNLQRPVARTGAGRALIRHPMQYRVRSHVNVNTVRYSEDVSQDLRTGGRVLVLGEPGSGKTTTLLNAALQACREAQLSPTKPIPVVVPMNLFTGDCSVRDFVRTQMAELGTHLERLEEENRLLILFDALNETSPDGRRELREYIRSMRQFVVTCRTKDYERELESLNNLSLITILPLDLRRIKTACELILAEEGADLWTLLGGSKEVLDRWDTMSRRDEANRFWDSDFVPDYTNEEQDQAWREMLKGGVMELCRNPFLLRVVTDIYRAEGSVPKNRGAIFATSVGTLIRRELERNAKLDGREESHTELSRHEFLVREVLVLIAGLIQERQQGAGIDAATAANGVRCQFGEEAIWAINVAEDASILRRTADRLVFPQFTPTIGRGLV